MASRHIRPNDAGLHGALAGIDVPMAPPQEMDVALWRGKCTALTANTRQAELLFIERWMEKGASPATAFGPCNDVAWRTGSLVDQALLFICLIVAGSA